MGMQKFESFEKESKVKTLSTTLASDFLSIEGITDDMIDQSLTKLEMDKISSGYNPKANYGYSRRYEKFEEIVNIVEEKFIDLLHDSIGRNDKEFLKKAVKFIKENG